MDGLHAPRMPVEQVIDVVADDAVRPAFAAGDNAARWHVRARVPFQVDRAMAAGRVLRNFARAATAFAYH